MGGASDNQDRFSMQQCRGAMNLVSHVCIMPMAIPGQHMELEEVTNIRCSIEAADSINLWVNRLPAIAA
jgi:hypothetical protein